MSDDLLDFDEKRDNTLPIYNRTHLLILTIAPMVCISFEFAGFQVMALFVMISSGVLTGYLMARFMARSPKGGIYVLSWIITLIGSGLLIIFRYNGLEYWQPWAVWGAGLVAPLLFTLFNKR